jgi:integrase
VPKLLLSPKNIPHLKAKDDKREEVYRDTKVRGLLLEVHPNGRKTFVAWSRIHGTKDAFREKLGVWEPGVFDLAHARAKAKVPLHMAAMGKNPTDERRRAKEAGTFGDLAQSFLKAVAVPGKPDSIRPSTREEWRLLLEHPRLAKLRAQRTPDVTRGDLIRLFDKIRDDSFAEGRKGYSANRTLEAVRRVFSWAVSKDLVTATPCVGVEKPVKEVDRDRTWDANELGAIYRSLSESPSTQGDAVTLALLTGRRINEALGAKWTEIDTDAKTWTIPEDREGNKAGVMWVVPLPPPAIAMLERRRAEVGGDWAFPAMRRAKVAGQTKRRQRAMERIAEMSGVEDFRPHDGRRTIRTWMGEHGVPQAIANLILGHIPPRLERIYDKNAYLPEKSAALDRWAAHVERVAAKKPAKVIAMPGVGA